MRTKDYDGSPWRAARTPNAERSSKAAHKNQAFRNVSLSSSRGGGSPHRIEPKAVVRLYRLTNPSEVLIVAASSAFSRRMKREAGGLGEFLLCPQGKAASPRFMGVIVLGDVC